MMSAAHSQTTMEAKLKALQCHFTWDLESSRHSLFLIRDMVEDNSAEEGNSWLGHIYNLQGYIHYQLGFTEDARSFFSRATEAFHQMRNTVSDGPWLLVNYGNLAWLHHHLGEKAESQTYLSKVDTLLEEYPSPSQDELHPEIYAEKACTLMKCATNQKLLVADYFQRAIRMQPDMVEWHTSRAIALVLHYKSDEPLEEDIFEEMTIAKERDPENLYLVALYLEECAKRGRRIEDEARELAERVLRKPASSYSGITPLLRLFRDYVSIGEAVDLTERALEKHPDERNLLRCAALCYKRLILSHNDNLLKESTIERAISLHKMVMSLYSYSPLEMKLSLASIYEKSNHSQEADEVYQELLQIDLEDAVRQRLYNNYAKYLHFTLNKSCRAIKYHMKAAEITLPSRSRESSIRTLEKIRDRNRHRMCAEIEDFLANLQD